MTTLFVEQLTVIDCAILDRQRGLIGQSWIVDVYLEGALDEQGMILDFGPAKRLIKQAIDARVDHKLLVPGQAPGLVRDTPGRRLDFTDDTGNHISHSGPDRALCPIDAPHVDTEAVAAMLGRELTAALPANVQRVGVKLRQERIEGPAYAYCHGLKKHDGNCQRIAHGHRSRLEILADGERSPQHENRWASRWRDIYLGSREDLVTPDDARRYRFAYTAAEGRYELEMEAARCDLLEADSTVENIAAHIAQKLKQDEPGRQFTVRAYEGVNKGAIASA